MSRARPTRTAASVLATLLLLLPAACRSAEPGADPDLGVLVHRPDGSVGGWDELETALEPADVVCVGESHDSRAHHQLQLRVLESMQEQREPGEALLLGMEMFQRPYQEGLDAYVAGEIDELEMLRRTEYFQRWRFDHTLYAPLWRYCREHDIRIVGLNAPRDVTTKIRVEGFEALTDEERSLIAEEIDVDVASHRERVMAIFKDGVHPLPDDALEGYYRSQTTWDETMAESAARAVEAAGPGARMLVIAGAFHIQEWDGIPDRAARRLPGRDVLVIVARDPGRALAEGQSHGDLGDFVLVPTDDKPRLGVAFAEDPVEGGLRIERVVPGGTAGTAGVVQGDVLAELGGEAVRDVDQVRYFLDRSRIGDSTTGRVIRDGELFSVQLVLVPTPRPPMTIPQP